jgi:formate dehydrogenase maturation protein FdhE
MSMSQVLHYQDDLFLINSLARFMADASKLEPDPEILGDTLAAVARATDSSFRRIRELVLEKPHLVDRLDYIKLLADIAETVSEALERLMSADSSMAANLSSSTDEMTRMVTAHRAACSDLREMLRESLNGIMNDENQVSGDELNELLRF